MSAEGRSAPASRPSQNSSWLKPRRARPDCSGVRVHIPPRTVVQLGRVRICLLVILDVCAPQLTYGETEWLLGLEPVPDRPELVPRLIAPPFIPVLGSGSNECALAFKLRREIAHATIVNGSRISDHVDRARGRKRLAADRARLIEPCLPSPADKPRPAPTGFMRSSTAAIASNCFH